MSIQVFRCEQCGKEQERIVVHYSDKPPDCTECGFPTKRVLAVPAPAQWSCSKGSL